MRAHQTTVETGRAAVDEGLRSYMLRVYNLMALAVAFAAAISLYIASTPALLSAVAGGGFWIAFGAILLLGFFAPKLIMSGSGAAAHACFWTYAGAWGVGIAPAIAHYGGMDPMLIVRAFAIASATFAGMSLLGYTTKKNLSGLGAFFAMATIGLLVAMLVNVFFVQSELMSLVVSGLVVLVFAGITAWETQEIKNLYLSGEDAGQTQRKAIFGAFMLFGSFVTLFVHILNILGIMED